MQTLLWRCLFIEVIFVAVATTLNEPYDPSAVFCNNRTSYIPVGTSWMTRCVTYRCTLEGIQADNVSLASCDFLLKQNETSLNCSSTIVESDNDCCQGTVCPKPLESLPKSIPFCSPGWTEWRVLSNGLGNTTHCIKYSQSKKTFQDAAQDCRSQGAALIKLKNWRPTRGALLHLEEETRKYDAQFWTGLSFEGTNYYWDDIFWPTIEHEFRNICSRDREQDWDYGWDCGQPDGNASCVRAKFDLGKIFLGTTACSQQLHYICLRDTSGPLNYEINGNAACPKDWLLSPKAKKCYKFFNDRLSAFRAMSLCQELNATLASASDRDQLLAIQSCIPDSSKTVPKEIHGGVCLSGFTGCVQPNSSLPIWYTPSSDRWYCKTIQNLKLPWASLTNYKSNENLSSCHRNLPYVCEKHTSEQTVGGLEIEGSSPADSFSDRGQRLKCLAHGLTESAYCSWRADGVVLGEHSCELVVWPYLQIAYECFTTALTTGQRIFSPLLVTGKGRIDESLRLTVILSMSPSLLLHLCGYSRVPPELLSLVTQLLLMNSSSSTIGGGGWVLKPGASNVACWASFLQSTATIIYAVEIIELRRTSRFKRDALNAQHQVAIDEVSNVIEAELIDYWIRTQNGKVILEGNNSSLQIEQVSVKSLRFCGKQIVLTKELGELTVPRTVIGEWFNLSLCLTTARPILSMYCHAKYTTGAFWETYIKSECPDTFSLPEKRLKLLISNLTTDTSASWHLSEALSAAQKANNESGMTTMQIVDVSHLVKISLSFLSESDSVSNEDIKIAKSIPALVDQVMRAPAENVWQSELVDSSSTILTKALEVVSELLLAITPEENTTRLIFENVAIAVSSDPALEGIGVLSSEAFSQTSVVELRSNHYATTGVHYIAQIVAWLREGGKSTKRFTLYRNDKLFKGRLRVPATDMVLSANIDEMDEDLITPEFIRAKFPNVKGVSSEAVECGFWSYADNDWSTTGCRKVLSDNASTLCYCNHTTSFAILMGAKPQDSIHYKAQSLITLIGLGISITALLLVLVTFLMLKGARQALSQKLLFNLALALFLLDITFIAGSQSTKNKAACMVISILLHYLLLTSFAWMAVEGVHQYFRFVKVIGTYIPRFIIKAAIPAWGLPAVVVGIILAADYQLYGRLDNACWVQGPVLYYGVLLPIALILAFNFVVFALILRSLMCQKNSILRSNQDEMQLMKLHLRAAVALLVVMGLTWIFGFLVFQETGTFGLVSQYLFCIFNSIQGILIFIFHCIREKNVITYWKTLFKRGDVVTKVDELSTTGTNDRYNTLQMHSKKPSVGSTENIDSTVGGPQ